MIKHDILIQCTLKRVVSKNKFALSESMGCQEFRLRIDSTEYNPPLTYCRENLRPFFPGVRPFPRKFIDERGFEYIGRKETSVIMSTFVLLAEV